MRSMRMGRCVAWVAVMGCALLPGFALAAGGPAIPIQDQIGMGNREGLIRLERSKPLLVEKVGFADCRAVRAFIHNPVDGRLDSRHYGNWVWEYPNPRGDGAHYDFNNGDGLHIRLADDEGFDAMLIRGGYVGTMYRNANALDGPGDAGVLVCEVKSRNNVFRKIFRQRLRAAGLDYYQPKRVGYFADVSFFRMRPSQTVPRAERAESFGIGASTEPTGKIKQWLTSRFGAGERVYQATSAPGAGLQLKRGEFVHVLAPAEDRTRGIVGVGLKCEIARADAGSMLTVRVQDPLNPRRELMGADFQIPGPGAYEIVLDTPDAVFLPAPGPGVPKPILEGQIAPDPVLWLSVAADAPMQMRSLGITIHQSSREAAMPEAMALRKLLLKGYFYAMSEPRPWMGLRSNTKVRDWLQKVSGGRYRFGLEQLFETVEQCRMLDPKDDIIRQYYEWLYQRKQAPGPWKIELPDAPGAPRWAVLAREGFRAASHIPRWWMANRKAPNGELGGWVGDDSDMFQTWASFPLIESAPLGDMLRDGAWRLSELALATRLEHGLNRHTTDPLHAYEEGTNHLAICAWWFYGDPVHFERAMEAARSVPRMTVKTKDGRRHFHGQRLGAADLKKMGQIDRDGGSHPLFMHPVYEVVWYNRNPEALKFYSEWADTWIAFQKPGQWATAVDVNTGKVTSTSSRPGRGAYEGQSDAWFGLYHATGDPRFLKPFALAFDAGVFGFKRWRQIPNFVTAPAFASRIAQFRQRFGGSGYAGFLLTGNRKALEPDLEATVREYQRFPHIYTSAEQFTDRVFTTQFGPVSLCYTGSYTTRNSWKHYHAVSYEGFKGTDFAALVSLIRPDALKVSMYNFTDKVLEGRMRVWRLDHGRYTVRVGPDANDDSMLDSVDKQTPAELYRYAPVKLTLPPRRLTLIDITQTEKLDDILERADLALSPLDTRLERDGTLVVRVHNIGAKTAAGVQVVLMRRGKQVASRPIPTLDAPLDLVPCVATVTFERARAGDEVVVDPSNAIPEIAEHNNRLVVR